MAHSRATSLVKYVWMYCSLCSVASEHDVDAVRHKAKICDKLELIFLGVRLETSEFCFRCKVLGGARRQTEPTRRQGTRREREGGSSATVRRQDYRPHPARRPHSVWHRPLRRVVRSLHRRLRPHHHPSWSERPAVAQDARRRSAGKQLHVFIQSGRRRFWITSVILKVRTRTNNQTTFRRLPP